MNGVATDSERHSWLRAFMQTLNNLGWIEGKKVQIDTCWNDGDADRACGSSHASVAVGKSKGAASAPSGHPRRTMPRNVTAHQEPAAILIAAGQ
jgi:hypothetical protein